MEGNRQRRDRAELETILTAVQQHGPGWTRREVIIQSIPAVDRPDRPGNAFGYLKRRGFVEARQHERDSRRREYKPTGKELPITPEAATAD